MTQLEVQLELLEQGHVEAEEAKAALIAKWGQEDVVTAALRTEELERHAQGDRDRDAMRVALGGTSLIEAKAQAEQAERETKAQRDQEAREAREAQVQRDREAREAEAKREAAAREAAQKATQAERPRVVGPTGATGA